MPTRPFPKWASRGFPDSSPTSPLLLCVRTTYVSPTLPWPKCPPTPLLGSAPFIPCKLAIPGPTPGEVSGHVLGALSIAKLITKGGHWTEGALMPWWPAQSQAGRPLEVMKSKCWRDNQSQTAHGAVCLGQRIHFLSSPPYLLGEPWRPIHPCQGSASPSRLARCLLPTDFVRINS